MILAMLWSYIAFFMNVLFGNTTDPNRELVTPYVMTADMLQIADRAVRYSDLVWTIPSQGDAITQVFEDPFDRVMLRYHADEGVCYAAWKGANIATPLNVLQSWSVLPANVCGSEGCCLVGRGMHEAYYADYVEEFEDAVDDCYNNCPGGCKVVLTGHSQGAAIAPVAAVALQRYDPILMTYGQHLTLWGPQRCEVLENMETYLRFTTICDTSGTGSPVYDSISIQGYPWLNHHTGTMIMIGPDGAATVARNRGMIFMPVAEPCHNVDNWYKPYIRDLSPGPFDGFSSGAMCSRDIECQSQSCSNQRCD